MAIINGTPLANILIGTNLADTINGLAGNDTLIGLGGNDLLDGGAGADTMVGGTGNDTYVVDNVGDVVAEGFNEGIDSILSSISLSLNVNGRFDVENLTLTGAGAINGAGNSLNNVMNGNNANNTLNGLAGNDSIRGLGGNDSLFGGIGNDFLLGGIGNDLLDGGVGVDNMRGEAGNDIYVVDNVGDVVTELAGEGTDTIRSTITTSLNVPGRLFVENLQLMGAAAINGTGNALNNVIIGNSANNVLSGLSGNDTLSSGAGNDTLDGGLGADTMLGGIGNDFYFVDNVGDVVTEGVGAGIDTISSSISTSLNVAGRLDVENLTLTGVAPISGVGNALNNTINGNAANNTLNGLGGNDTLLGQGGNDVLLGGAGNDTMNGGIGADTMAGGSGNDVYVVDNVGDVVSEAAGGGIDTIQSSITTSLNVAGRLEVENLVLTGGGAINGTGNALGNVIVGNSGVNALSGLSGNDTILGGGGNDNLNGGLGNDTLSGGAGTDTMTGGLGGDIFVFDAPLGAANVDVILDFAPVSDTIHLQNSVFTALGVTGTLAAAAFRIGANALDASDRIMYDPATGALNYDPDGTGGVGQIQFGDLASGLAMTNADFVVI